MSHKAWDGHEYASLFASKDASSEHSKAMQMGVHPHTHTSIPLAGSPYTIHPYAIHPCSVHTPNISFCRINEPALACAVYFFAKHIMAYQINYTFYFTVSSNVCISSFCFFLFCLFFRFLFLFFWYVLEMLI